MPLADTSQGLSLTMLGDQLLTADAANFDFLNISAAYINLMIVAQERSALAALTDDLIIRMNNDSGANYHWEVLAATNTVVSAAGFGAQTSARVASCPGESATALRAAATIIWIPNYTAQTFHKSWNSVSQFSSDSAATGQSVRDHAGVWANNNAITRITLLLSSASNLRSGSRATIYGF